MVSSKQKFWRSVFRRVMSRFDELKSVQGTNSCAGFYRALELGFSGGERNPKVIQMTPSDFIADVELAAQRGLTPCEYYFFKKLYLEKESGTEAKLVSTVGEEETKLIEHKIQELLGQEFYRCKIYPVERYIKSSDIR